MTDNGDRDDELGFEQSRRRRTLVLIVEWLLLTAILAIWILAGLAIWYLLVTGAVQW